MAVCFHVKLTCNSPPGSDAVRAESKHRELVLGLPTQSVNKVRPVAGFSSSKVTSHYHVQIDILFEQ